MIVVGFEDRDGGQRRVVVRELVGGWALRDGDNTTIGGADTQSAATSPPAHAHPPDRSATPKWSWRDTDGSVHNYRLPHSSTSTPSSPSPLSSLPSSSLPSSNLQRFPPDGGVGLRVLAAWSYFPPDGVADELGFPKNAEIREAEDINGDWFWGVYCGVKGLFPGNYGRVVGGGKEVGGRF
jgi:hypothetical protein